MLRGAEGEPDNAIGHLKKSETSLPRNYFCKPAEVFNDIAIWAARPRATFWRHVTHSNAVRNCHHADDRSPRRAAKFFKGRDRQTQLATGASYESLCTVIVPFRRVNEHFAGDASRSRSVFNWLSPIGNDERPRRPYRNAAHLSATPTTPRWSWWLVPLVLRPYVASCVPYQVVVRLRTT